MKDLKVSNETHSLLFSLKNQLILSQNKKFTYDEVMKVLLHEHDILVDELQDQDNMSDITKGMYQLEEKQ